GDEYYYYKLRVPALNQEFGEFERLDRYSDIFENDEKLRTDLQVALAKLGRSGKFSLYDYLEFLSDVKKDIPVLTILDWLVYIGIVVLMFFAFYPALVLMIVWIIANVLAYLFRKKKIEPYFYSFEYILRMLQTANTVIKLLPDDFADAKNELKEAKKKLSGISSGNLVFLQSNTSSAIGDIGNGLMNFVNMFFHTDIFLFFRMKEQVENHIPDVDTIFETLGMLDFAINIASYRKTLPYYTIPEFSDDCSISTKDMIHPLLYDKGVSNSIDVNGGILLTGSNASGKSTFLRMIGINAILAQSIHTVYAKEYRADLFAVYSSMSLKDDMEAGESYYMAEIRSIKRILEAVENPDLKVLCFVDEVLRGTNTKERIAAGCEIMRYMQKPGNICFAATHDIELAHMLPPLYTNYHFDEEIKDDDINFPYQLKESYATTRNAIALLILMGYPEEITDNAIDIMNKQYDRKIYG
ncbi:MAG: hypothetical protein IKO32_12735, partial [Lachnospiraceae bacterium]|nr:hypothetical protein [Lachnospiraceae bacterium]